MKISYALAASIIFLSSFLLFQIQPLISKHIVAWFGGGSAVWVTAMLFFMVALALGYIYAWFLTKASIRRQLIIHFLVLLGVLACLKVQTGWWPSGITPMADDLVLDFTKPIWSVVWTLSVAVGLPFVFLSSTSTLLQFWYGKFSSREPFSLYGISNVGSLLGLLSYPLVFEPLLSTYEQGRFWVAGLAVFAGLMTVFLSPLLTTRMLTATPDPTP